MKKHGDRENGYMSDDQLWLLLTAPTNNSKENSSSSSSSFADEVVAELRESLRSAPLEIDSRVKKILRLHDCNCTRLYIIFFPLQVFVLGQEEGGEEEEAVVWLEELYRSVN